MGQKAAVPEWPRQRLMSNQRPAQLPAQCGEAGLCLHSLLANAPSRLAGKAAEARRAWYLARAFARPPRPWPERCAPRAAPGPDQPDSVSIALWRDTPRHDLMG